MSGEREKTGNDGTVTVDGVIALERSIHSRAYGRAMTFTQSSDAAPRRAVSNLFGVKLPVVPWEVPQKHLLCAQRSRLLTTAICNANT